ncbi:MAG: hypothetical protein PVG50_07025 [Thiohalophilus sp.]|jgi:hypothetical protein
MKQERRLFARKATIARANLYHPALGTLQANVEDWSLGGVRVTCETLKVNGHDFSQDYFQLEPDYMDVIFTMEFVRLDERGMVLRFVDGSDIVAGDRL